MGSVWLKMIGTAEIPCPDVYDRDHVDFTKEPRDVHPGDGLVLYAVGCGTRVFAVARATSDPYPSDDERFPFRVNIEYLVNRNVNFGVGIRQISDRNLIGPIQYGSSYLRLQQEEYDRAEALLRQAEATSATAADGRVSSRRTSSESQ